MPEGNLKLVGVVDRVDGVSVERLSSVALKPRVGPAAGAPTAGQRGVAFPSSTQRPRRAEQRIRLVLAYRHTLLRQALRQLLTAQSQVEVLAEVADGKDAVDKAERLRPDVVLLDLALPILDGIEATRLIKRRAPNTRVILLTLGATDEDLVRALQAGVSGCLVKDADETELALALAAVQRGASYLSPAISERVAQSCFHPLDSAARPATDPLSVREREVLQLIADGLSNQEIAARLVLSVKTVEAHKAHIMRKLNIRGRTELIKYAIRKGLITIEG